MHKRDEKHHRRPLKDYTFILLAKERLVNAFGALVIFGAVVENHFFIELVQTLPTYN